MIILLIVLILLIIPKSIIKPIGQALVLSKEIEDRVDSRIDYSKISRKEIYRMLSSLEKEMLKAAKELDFERAMELRDTIFEIKKETKYDK